MSVLQVVFRLVSYLRQYPKHLFLLLVGMICDICINTGLRLSFKFLIDDALTPRNWVLLIQILVALVLAAFLRSAIAVGRDYLYAYVSNGVINQLRLKLYMHLQRLPMSFFNRTKVGDITTRFSTDLSSIENAMLYALPVGAYSILAIGFSSVPLLLMEWHMALLAIIGLPICLIAPQIWQARALSTSYRTKEEQARVASTLQENIMAQTVLKIFSLNELFSRRFRKMLDLLFLTGVRSYFLGFVMERTSEIAIQILEILFLGIGAILVFRDQLSVGSFISIHALFLSLSQVTGNFAGLFPHFVQASSGIQRVDELLSQSPQKMDAVQPIPTLARAIQFDDVTFSYTGDQPVLSEVSFKIHRGEMVAFVGSSGSGKSTILNLILKLYIPNKGCIRFDEHDLSAATSDSIRLQTAVVLQDNFLFNTTIRENIRLGRIEATDADVETAARAAEIHDYISRLPKGYDTAVGERGVSLSGGQRQRIAIARAIIRNPQILILDEATSALDSVTESAINATLERIGRGRTTICVTHRLASVQNMDRIFVLDHGRLMEHGNHNTLLQDENGIYKQLWQKQSGVTLSKDGDHFEIELEWMRKITILQDLDSSLLQEMVALFVTESYPADRAVVYQGDIGDRFYIIVRGTVDVFVTNEDGSESRVTALQDGDYFGEIALINETPRSATIRTRTPSVFISLRRYQFMHMIRKASPQVVERLERQIQKRLDELLGITEKKAS